MDVTGTTPLMLASSRGKKEIIDFLIDKGADINQKDNSGYGSIWCAVFYRQYETVGHLISRGADKSDFPLFYAVCMNDVEWIKKLLGKGENPDSRGFNNQTPLHFAGSVEVAELLMGKGADINAIDDEDITPLCRAIDRNNKKLIEFFIKKGSIINIPDVYGGTPLHRAVYNDNKGIAELLISCGALINEKDGLGRTPLDCAKSEGMKKILRKYGGKTHKEINKE